MLSRCSLSVVLASIALAVAPAHAQQGRGGGGPEGGPQQRGGFRMSAERLMEMDANGDGKLSRDEMPEQFAERIFEAADANKDGFLDRAEIDAFVASRQGGPGGPGGPGFGAGPGGPGGAQGEPMSFDRQMSMAGRAMRGLRRSAFDAASRDNDLMMIATVQNALLGAKAGIDGVEMAPQAKEKYGTDEKAYRTALRKGLVESLMTTMALELAVLGDDAAGAKSALEKLLATQEAGHKAFQKPEEEGGERGGGRGGRGGEGGRGGRGGGAAGGGARGNGGGN